MIRVATKAGFEKIKTINELKPIETLKLPANGREVFSNSILEKGLYYELVISGLITYRFGWLGRHTCDAAYLADEAGNFVRPLDPLNHPHIFVFEEGPLPVAQLREHADRARNEYRLVIQIKRSTAFGLRIHYPRSSAHEMEGAFQIQIFERQDLLEAEQERITTEQRQAWEAQQKIQNEALRMAREREEVRLLHEAEEAEKQRRHELDLAEQKVREAGIKAREAEAQREQAFLKAKAQELKIIEAEEAFERQLILKQQEEKRRKLQLSQARFERLRNTMLIYKESTHYEDPEWIAKYARAHLDELLDQRQDILRRLVGFHADKVFVEALKKRSLETYARAIWQTKALAKAEQFEVDLKGFRPKLTPQEWRERKQRWLQLKADDAIALQDSKIKAIQDHRNFLDQYDLSDEERQDYEAEFLDEIFKATAQAKTPQKGDDHEIVS